MSHLLPVWISAACAAGACYGGTGFGGGEPAAYEVTLHADAAAEAGGDGTAAAPFRTLAAAVERGVRPHLSAGRSVHLKIRPGRYDETVPPVSGGIDAGRPLPSAPTPFFTGTPGSKSSRGSTTAARAR